MKSSKSQPSPTLNDWQQQIWKYALSALGAALAVSWVAVWQWQLRMEIAMAISIGAALLALGVVALRAITGQRDAAPYRTSMPAPMAADAQPAADSSVALDNRRWSLDIFAAIDTRHFTAMCEAWFHSAGFETRCESHRADEGVDLWLHAARMPGPVAIVRCKHWLNKPVGLQEMQEFCGLVSAHKSAHGTYTTTSTYTQEALEFAQQHGIDAVDGRGLLRRIQSRTRQSQQALLAVAFNGSTA